MLKFLVIVCAALEIRVLADRKLDALGYAELTDLHHCTSEVLSHHLDCSGRDLEKIPEQIVFPEDIQEVSFSGNKIESVVTASFSSGNRLRLLDVSHNAVSLISSQAFIGLPSLVTIDLSYNKIFTIPIEAFVGLNDLSKINLGVNKLDDFDPEIFKDCINVKQLDLSRNNFIELREYAFNHLAFLDVLNLEDNELVDLPDKLFEHNGRLRKLSLAGNHFEEVPIKALQSAQNIQMLDLSSTRLKSLSSKDFAGLQMLNELRLTNIPSLKSIKEFAFQDLINVQVLQVENCIHLREIDAKAFTSSKTLETLASLQDLSLKRNALTTLAGDALAWEAIQHLDLTQNPWRCDCHLRWIAKVPIRKEHQKKLICAKPHSLANALIAEQKSKDFTCPFFGSDFMVIGVVLVIIVSMMGFMTAAYVCVKLALCNKMHGSNCCRRKQKSNGYVRVVPTKDTVDLEWDHSAEPTHA